MLAGRRRLSSNGHREVLTLVAPQGVLDLIHGKRIQLHDLRRRPEGGRHDAPGLILARDIYDHPCFVVTVHAPPVGAREKVRPRPEKHLDDAGAGGCVPFMGNLNEESRHSPSPLSNNLRLSWSTLNLAV